MKITILGSGGWAGIPVAFCRCRVCILAMKEPNSKNNRTRPEILVEGKNGDTFLIEISPDIRLQSGRFNLPDIRNFLVTHKHFDHLDGLTQLNSWIKYYLKKKPFIWCNQETSDFIKEHYSDITTLHRIVTPFKSFKLADVKITPVPLRHISEEDETGPLKDLNAYGYILEAEGKKFVYMGDYYQIPEKSYKMLVGADVAIVDGTYLLENIFPKDAEHKGLKDDPDHLHGKEIFDFATSLAAKKVVFNNISHMSKKTHSELEKLLPKGAFLAYDGMTIDV